MGYGRKRARSPNGLIWLACRQKRSLGYVLVAHGLPGNTLCKQEVAGSIPAGSHIP
jgi:hypothetical protein